MNHKVGDTFFVLLNISNPYTIIPCLLFTPHTGLNSLIISILTLCYIVYRFGSRIKFPDDILFGLFVIIFIINMYVGLLDKTFALGFLGIFFGNIFFYFLLYNIYEENNGRLSVQNNIRYISNGYVVLCYYQLGIVAVLFLLTNLMHLFNPLINNISNKYDIFGDNANRKYSGLTYYFPYICLFVVSKIERIPFFQEYGLIAGVFHEPHTMTYYIIPFVFFSFFYFKNRVKSWGVVLLSILYVLVAGSTTNILCYVATTIFALCLNYRKLIFIILPLSFIGLSYFWLTDNPIVELIKFKLTSGSAEYSSSTLSYAFEPKTFFGSNFLDLSYLKVANPHQDVGFVIFTLNLLFLLILIYRSFRLCLSKETLYKFVGLFAVYFILHSSKLALRTYSLEILMYVIFLVSICYNDMKLKKAINKNENKRCHKESGNRLCIDSICNKRN